MKHVRLRVIRRYTSLENVEDFFRTEFCAGGEPELELSVFDIEEDTLVRAHAECAASWLSRPVDRCGLDLLGVSGAPEEPVRTQGKTEFSYTRKAHAELRFLHEEELRETSNHVFAELHSRRHDVKRSKMRTYVASQVHAGDREWQTLLSKKEKWLSWAIKDPSKRKGGGREAGSTAGDKAE